MIPEYLTEELERQQTQALKNIYGPGISARRLREKAGVKTLQHRREDATLKFEQKAAKSERFAHWFPVRARRNMTRNNRPYLEVVSRTERDRRSPINYMRHMLNNSLDTAPVTS